MPDIFDETKPNQNSPVNPHPIAPQSIQAQPVHILSSFAHHPEGISFANQTDGEEVVLFLRKAFITNLTWISTSIILLILPLFAFLLLQAIHFSMQSPPTNFPLVLIIFYYLLAIGYAFANFITWFYNIGIVTKKRVLDITFSNITAISVAATAVGDMRDVEYSQKSFSETLFDYGDVTIIVEETPARSFVFESAPHPAKVVDIISKLIHGDS